MLLLITQLHSDVKCVSWYLETQRSGKGEHVQKALPSCASLVPTQAQFPAKNYEKWCEEEEIFLYISTQLGAKTSPFWTFGPASRAHSRATTWQTFHPSCSL